MKINVVVILSEEVDTKGDGIPVFDRYKYPHFDNLADKLIPQAEARLDELAEKLGMSRTLKEGKPNMAWWWTSEGISFSSNLEC